MDSEKPRFKGVRALISVRTSREIELIRASCQVVSRVQGALERAVVPGVTTLELDRLAEETIRDCGGVPAFKGYRGFPASICASVNEQAVHGFPGPSPLEEGDIVSIDVGVLMSGYYGDGAFTAGVGQISTELQRLLDATRDALRAGIERARVRGRISDISNAVQLRVESEGFSVIREFSGHGVGRSLHEDPHVPNHGAAGKGPRLRRGYVLAIEPIVSMGGPDLEVAEDGWTTTTRDHAPVAHFEHTVAITEDGPDILTERGEEETRQDNADPVAMPFAATPAGERL